MFGGVLTVEGAEVVQLITGGAALSASDGRFGVDGLDYGGQAAGRGLDGADPTSHVPVVGDRQDAVRQVDRHTVRFWLGTLDDIDDLRILIRYPAEPGPASFGVQLFHRGRPDPLAWPVTAQGGVQIGHLVDTTADDGDYSEVFEVSAIKLRIEDLDLVESELDLGAVPGSGGLSATVPVTADNFADGVDRDQDNGFDQNGLISPIPAGSDLEHLTWLPEPLTAPGGARIEAEAVELEAPPGHLAVGEAVAVPVAVRVPPETPAGRYAGRLVVFEDNDGDGQVAGAEPRDAVRVVVNVLPAIDATVVDAAAVDAGNEDAAVGPTEDAGVEDAASTEDAAVGPTEDAAMPPTDGEPPPDDAVIPKDFGTLPDGEAADAADVGPPLVDASDHDGAGGGRDGAPGDGAAGGDGALDGEPPVERDAEAGADDGVDPPADATVDTGAPPAEHDGHVGHDGGAPEDLGDARGGAFSCATSGGRSGSGVLLAALALAPILRRRRSR